MAQGVKHNSVLNIHQTLHGYSDGHRQLAASVKLTPRDIKTMLVLSDISGPGARIDDNGYLTAYPLPESKVYALARTWAAPEMSRPGCVWTHTLLIDFSDLATLTDPTSVLPLFCRPNVEDVTDYAESLSLYAGQNSPGLSADAADFARLILAGIYGNPHSRIIVERPAMLNVDLIVMALWAQQWPRLRRAFRFCTMSAADRSNESIVFDLQFLPSLDRSVHSRFHGAVEVSNTKSSQQNLFDDSVKINNIKFSSEDWLDDAVFDLTNADVDGLRTFLWRIGGDVDSGREAFRSLCQLHVLVEAFNSNPQSIEKAITLLDEELTSVQARAARGIVANAVLEHPGQLDDTALDFVIRHLELVEPNTLSINDGHLGREIWRHNPKRFSQLLEGNDLQRTVTTNGLSALHVNELIDGIAQTPQLFKVALAHRPEIVGQPEFWSHDVSPIDATFAILTESPELRTAGLTAMIKAKRDNLAMRAVREFGSLDVLQVVVTLFEATTNNRQHLGQWLAAAASEPAAVAQVLVDEKVRSWELLSAIAHLIPPDAVPNEYGVDPWLIAVQALGEKEPRDADLFLSAYLLSRALGKRSHNPGELAQFSFEPIYMAVSADRLPDKTWQVLEHWLPWSFKWAVWDRCPRISTAVCDLFVKSKLSPQLFAQITSDNKLFKIMVKRVARNKRGRDFIGQVHRWMKDNNKQRHTTRIQMINKLLKKLNE